jgi:putative polyhydroxyalkanoate system protein
MSEISIRRAHKLPLDEARKAAEKVAAKLREDFELDYEWKRQVLHFERPGVSGELHVARNEVRLDAKLGFLLAFLKPRIEREIDQQFDRYFASPTKPAAPGTGVKKKPAKKRA